MLRRMAGEPVKGDSDTRASIAIGQTGLIQPAPDLRYESDGAGRDRRGPAPQGFSGSR